MLSQEETLKLIELSQNGDESAKEKLIKENAPLIKSLIKRYLNTLIAPANADISI